MQSKTGLILPGIFHGNELLEVYLQSSEEPLFEIEHELEFFLDKLALTYPFADTQADVWLDWLFYALGGEDYLRKEFNTTKKITIIKRLFDLYKAKGTAKGLRLNWQVLVDRQTLRINQPPSKSFNATSLTEEERQRWEAIHQEIRIYPFADRALKGWALIPKDYLGRGYAMTTDAGLRLADRVELYDPKTGDKSLLSGGYYKPEYVLSKAKNLIEIRKKGNAWGIFLSTLSLRKHLVTHKADKRLYNIELYSEYQDEIQKRHWFSIKPSLMPMRGYYENEYIKGEKIGIHLTNRYKDVYKDKGGSFMKKAYFVVSDAYKRIIKKMKLFDPERTPFFKREAFNYLNHLRIGALLRHHVEAYVDMSYKAPIRAFFFAKWLNNYLFSSDAYKRIDDMRWAGNLTRQAGCKVLVSITNRVPLRASSGIKSGKYITGQYVMTY